MSQRLRVLVLGGLLRLARCGAIISMPSRRNALVQGIAVVGAVTDPILWLGFDHVEVEAQLH